MSMTRTHWILLLLLIALGLRLAYALSLDPLLPYQQRGGDTSWYLANGAALVGATPHNSAHVQLSTLQPPPVYLIFIGIPQLFFSSETALIIIRILQAVLSTATCYCAYWLARRVAGERAGIFTLILTAFSPVFILESAQILTETLYLFWIILALVIYVYILDTRKPLAWLVLAGAIFGVATLTRAVLLLFPLGLVIHLFLIQRPRKALMQAVVLFAAYALVVSTWTIYNLARWDRFVIAGEGFAAMLYIGASGWESPRQVDINLAQDASSPEAESRQDVYVEGAQNVIGRDLFGYVQRRVGELVTAYIQPHAVTILSGESLRDLAIRWINQDRSLAGLLALVRGDHFLPKLLIYIWHYTVLLLGLLGIWQARKQWRVALPLVGFIAYVTLVHLVLYALPRYIFPTMPVWVVFAGVWWASWRRSPVSEAVVAQPQQVRV
jgi:4-amino-4-deoxy-L-arabinose transferase-like glycosyltransferase